MCYYVKGGKKNSMPQQLVRVFFVPCPLVCLGDDKKMLPYRKIKPSGTFEYRQHVQGAYVVQQAKNN